MNPASYGPVYYDGVFRSNVRKRNYLEGSLPHIKSLAQWIEGSVLDLGCGLGQMAEYAGDYTGVDFSEFAISFARNNSRNPKAKFICQDFSEFIQAPFPADTIILSEVLEHLDRPAAIAEFALANAKNRIIASVPVNMPIQSHIKSDWTKKEIENLFHRKPSLIEPGCLKKSGQARHWHILIKTEGVPYGSE